LERARTAAEAASLAKSRFLATMSHELRTPLNAVIGFSEVLSTDAPPQQTQEFAQAIQEAGRHLLSLIDDILDVTRAESGHLPVTLETLLLPPLLEGVERMMRPTAEAGKLQLVLEPPGPLPLLRGDEQRLRQVLLNLVTNAVKFTPVDGCIMLSARHDAQGLMIEVRDTGIGIAAADLSRVFEPFTQIDSQLARRYPGAGLGLYLCRVLTEAQGGTLTLESTEGEGTRAVLRFPPASLIPLA
jgi:signal transduction histidine kinase